MEEDREHCASEIGFSTFFNKRRDQVTTKHYLPSTKDEDINKYVQWEWEYKVSREEKSRLARLLDQ